MTEMSEPTIRLATPDDAPALLAIYEPYVRQTAITCEYEVPGVEEFAGRIERTLKRYPYTRLVWVGHVLVGQNHKLLV